MALKLSLGNASAVGIAAAILLVPSTLLNAATLPFAKPPMAPPSGGSPTMNPSSKPQSAPSMPNVKQPSMPSMPSAPSRREVAPPMQAPQVARPVAAPIAAPRPQAPAPQANPQANPQVKPQVKPREQASPKPAPVAAPVAPPNWRPVGPPTTPAALPLQRVEDSPRGKPQQSRPSQTQPIAKPIDAPVAQPSKPVDRNSRGVGRPAQETPQIPVTPARGAPSKPSQEKPRDATPSRKPVDADVVVPVAPPVVRPSAPVVTKPETKPTVDAGKPSLSRPSAIPKTPTTPTAPRVRPATTVPPTAIKPRGITEIVDIPDVDAPRKPRDIVKPKPIATSVTSNAPVQMPPAQVRPTRGAPLVDGNTLGGVPADPPITRDRGGNTNNGTINNTVNNTTIYNEYVSNVSYSNGWGGCDGWVPPCGPVNCWQPYDNDGFSFAIGFGGGGWNLGFYYGGGGAPLCGSWGNPWWNGYASSYYCQPAWNPCWNPCFRGYWSNYWWNCSPAPYGCYPVYPYTPAWCTPYWGSSVGFSSWNTSFAVNTATVYYPTIPPAPIVVPAPLPSPDAMWSLVSEGFDHDAANGFDQLAQSNPMDAISRVGNALAHGFGGDLTGAAIMMRQAMLIDPGVLARTPMNPALASRTTLLMNNLQAAVSAVPPSLDALYMKACCQVLLGNEADAYFTTTLLIRERDTSASTLALQGWLDLRLRNQI